MRHTYRFPLHIRIAVRQHVNRAVRELSSERFRQEPAYTIALAARLQGVAYKDEDGFVEFQSTSVDDRGPGAAESWSGIDWVITASVSDRRSVIKKAILIQSKLRLVEELSATERARLCHQVSLMRQHTRSPKIMETLDNSGIRIPRIISGNRFLKGKPYRSYDIGTYITRRVLTTLDGDTRPSLVKAVQDSSLTQLHVLARNNRLGL